MVMLGQELNANQYRLVRLAAAYESSLEWLNEGYKSAAVAIARMVDIHSSTASEWIRVGHSLTVLPLIDAAFASNELSYAKVRILTRRATEDNEQDLLEIAADRSANRLTTAIVKFLSGDETDEETDERLHDYRGLTVFTDADGMVVISVALPPNVAKPVVATIESLVRRVAATRVSDDLTDPYLTDAELADTHWADPELSREELLRPDDDYTSAGQAEPQPIGAAKDELLKGTGVTAESSADDSKLRIVASNVTEGGEGSSADDSSERQTAERKFAERLRELKQRWQPDSASDYFPTLAQQRADAFVLLFLEKDVAATTEVVIHVRGDGATFDDGTPITESAVCQRLDESFIRFMIHDSDRTPLDATNRRRHPTTRQKRVVLETHNHECVDCQSTDLLELDHNPPYEQTRHTVTTELEPRCAPCHRARHRFDTGSTNTGHADAA